MIDCKKERVLRMVLQGDYRGNRKENWKRTSRWTSKRKRRTVFICKKNKNGVISDENGVSFPTD